MLSNPVGHSAKGWKGKKVQIGMPGDNKLQFSPRSKAMRATQLLELIGQARPKGHSPKLKSYHESKSFSAR